MSLKSSESLNKPSYTVSSWKVWAVVILVIVGCVIAAGYEVAMAANLVDIVM